MEVFKKSETDVLSKLRDSPVFLSAFCQKCNLFHRFPRHFVTGIVSEDVEYNAQNTLMEEKSIPN